MTDSQAVALDLSESASQGDWRLLFLMRDEIKKVTEAGRAARRQGVSEGIQPHARRLHPDQDAGPRGDSADARISTARLKDFKGGEASPQARRSIPTPGEYREPRDRAARCRTA